MQHHAIMQWCQSMQAAKAKVLIKHQIAAEASSQACLQQSILAIFKAVHKLTCESLGLVFPQFWVWLELFSHGSKSNQIKKSHWFFHSTTHTNSIWFDSEPWEKFKSDPDLFPTSDFHSSLGMTGDSWTALAIFVWGISAFSHKDKGDQLKYSYKLHLYTQSGVLYSKGIRIPTILWPSCRICQDDSYQTQMVPHHLTSQKNLYFQESPPTNFKNLPGHSCIFPNTNMRLFVWATSSRQPKKKIYRLCAAIYVYIMVEETIILDLAMDHLLSGHVWLGATTTVRSIDRGRRTTGIGRKALWAGRNFLFPALQPALALIDITDAFRSFLFMLLDDS